MSLNEREVYTAAGILLDEPEVDAEDILTDLAAYWPCHSDPGAGIKAPRFDYVAGKNFTYNPGSVPTALDPFGYGTQFTAADQHRLVSSLGIIAPFTMGFWIELQTTADQGIIGQWGNPFVVGGGDRLWQFALKDGKFVFRISGSPGEDYTLNTVDSGVTAVVDTLYYVRGGWDGIHSWIQVNAGQLKRTQYNGGLANSVEPISLGGFPVWNSYGSFIIADIAIWNGYQEEWIGEYIYDNEIPIPFPFVTEALDFHPNIRMLGDVAQEIPQECRGILRAFRMGIDSIDYIQVSDARSIEGTYLLYSDSELTPSLGFTQGFSMVQKFIMDLAVDPVITTIPEAYSVDNRVMMIGALERADSWVGVYPPTKNVWR